MTKYLILKGKYGFGNRLQALCQALVYCQLTGRQIVVDWRDARYSDSGENAYPLLFESLGFDIDLLDRAMNSVSPAIWKGMLDKEIDWMKVHFAPHATSAKLANEAIKKFSISPLKLNSKKQVVVMCDYKFNLKRFARHLDRLPHAWPKTSSGDLLHYLFKTYIVPRYEIRKKVKDFKAAYFSNPTIGIHVRYTDNVRGRNKPLEVLDVYFVAIDKLRKKYPSATLFLATDNQRVEKRFAEKYENLIVMGKQYPDKENQSIHHRASGLNKTTAAKEALQELYLLSECDYLVHSSGSTFAKLAAIISEMPIGNLIDVGYRWPLSKK